MLAATSNFTETDPSLVARLLSRFKQLTQSVFRFLRDNYTPALPINSRQEAYEEERYRDVRRRHRERG